MESEGFMKTTRFIISLLIIILGTFTVCLAQNNAFYYEGTAAQVPAQFSRLSKGDIVSLGSYEQDNNRSNGQEPIEWIVISVQNGMAVLLSRYGIDAKPYNRTDTDVTWETCSLRKWLNNDFYNSAFTNNEKQLILDASIENLNNREFGTYGGRDTQDHVFLLDIDEFNKYLSGSNAAKCRITPIAKTNGAKVWTSDYASWWLRSPSYYQGGATCINGDGKIDYNANVGNNTLVVRPAILIIYNP